MAAKKNSPETSTELPIATLASILGVNDTDESYIDVPQWGQRVKIKGLSKADQIAARKRSTTKGALDEDKLQVQILTLGMTEPSLTPVEAEKLFSKSMGAVDIILGAIFEKSGMNSSVDTDADADFQG